MTYIDITVESVANTDVKIQLPDLLKNNQLIIPFIYGHRHTNDAKEYIFFDNTQGVRYFHLFSNISQPVVVRFFYIPKS